MSTTRRLAAVMAADVVGYGSLMEQDEAGTLAALKARRKGILGPLVAEHRGRIVKVMGDGVLVEFASAVNAVACAVELQKRMAAANDGLPEERRILLRIGINLGDVIVEGGDLYGDGVNIAARLQTLAEPGAIFVSAKVRDEVGRKLAIAFEDLGERGLKNVGAPVRIYRVTPPPLLSPTSWGREASVGERVGAAASPSRPSIAVLPFDNLSGDPEQQYFSDGITEDIITELSRFRSLSVLARNASFRFRGHAVDVKQVGRELGVQYLAEGSVRKLGDRIRITAQLIDAASGNHLWAERFDRSQHDIFAVQDQVVRTIVGTLVGRLEVADVEQAKRKPPASLVAYDCVLRGNALPVGDVLAEAEARRMYEKAIALDPTYGRAHSLLAYALSLEWFRDMTGSNALLDRALELAKKAVQLDDTNSDCVNELAWIHLNRRAFDPAEQCYRRALELNPNNPHAVASMAIWLTYVGRPEEAFECFKQARLVDPHFNPAWWTHMLGVAHFAARQYDEAIAAFGRSSTNPLWVRAYLAACHALTDKRESAGEFSRDVFRLAPEFSASRFVAKEPYQHRADRERLLEGLRKAGLPE